MPTNLCGLCDENSGIIGSSISAPFRESEFHSNMKSAGKPQKRWADITSGALAELRGIPS